MPKTVMTAFAAFLSEDIRLNPDRTKIAKTSLGYLIDNIEKFPDNGIFPQLFPEKYIQFGSFSRKTKIRPLDDIDIMIILHADGTNYNGTPDSIQVYNNSNNSKFADLCYPNSNIVNSTKVLNRFKSYLSNIDKYEEADIKKNQEAVTLKLSSYEWVFDIVPCFKTEPVNGRDYYNIPDGKGGWKMTDPRIDKQNVESKENAHITSIVDVVRLVKYWNNRNTMPSIGSYLLEVMALNYYSYPRQSSQRIEYEFPLVLASIAQQLNFPVNDPKGLQGNLNNVPYDERQRVIARANLDVQKTNSAIRAEMQNNITLALEYWTDVFGPEFYKHTI